MVKVLKQYVYLSSSFLLLYSCNTEYKGNLTLIKANYENNYSYPCTVSNVGKKLNIDYIYKYKDGKLIEYQGCASEGLYTENFEDTDNYSKEDYEKRDLNVKKLNNRIVFFDREYKIIRKNKDSIFTSDKNKDEYLIFVGKIPL